MSKIAWIFAFPIPETSVFFLRMRISHGSRKESRREKEDAINQINQHVEPVMTYVESVLDGVKLC